MFTINSVCIVLALACYATSLPLTEEVPKSVPVPVPEEIKKIPLTVEEIADETEPKPVEIDTKILIDNSTNGTAKDLYVIRTVVYEVGILTDVDNSTLNDTQSHEQVDLTFFDPKHNGSLIDLSNIPIPIQTNISGVSVTGIAPANLGTIQLGVGDQPATLVPNFPLQVPILPNALITVKHNISTTNSEHGAELISNLPALLNLSSPITGEPLKIENPVETKVVEAVEDKTKETKAGDEKPTEVTATKEV